MPRIAWMRLLPALSLAVLAGCAGDPMVLKGQVQNLQQQQTTLARQNKEIQDRATALDRDNQELGTLLAQAKQKNQVLEDQLAAVRDQLGSATGQLTQLKDQKQATESKVQALNASLQRQGGVAISPNSSLLQTLPTINIPQVNVRRDGDVVRIELPGNMLFDVNSAQLRPGADRVITTVGAEVIRTYPNQIIGVEGHTDSDPIMGGAYRNNHQLSAARATVVQEVLLNQVRIPGNQLFLAGHGPNHPVVSNATPEGKERNRRVELVVYPERVTK
jgi:chemotaxis protein MotB